MSRRNRQSESVWQAHWEGVPSGSRLTIGCDSRRLTYRDLFVKLENNPEFSRWYSRTLIDSGYDAFFWEHPPLTKSNFDDPAELVLLESATLAELRADPRPFARHFALHPGADIVRFTNLGGDALLVVPCPTGAGSEYPHLAAFLHNAQETQVRALWVNAAQALRERLGTSPLWLSTAGLGVSWLHLRLDSRPKYYRFQPYKTPG